MLNQAENLLNQTHQSLFKGEPVQLPLDLFIPADALEILLDHFEGPLDLLLYLIKKNHFDILDIPISAIAKQYTDYVLLLDKNRFDLASEYLVMAAWLAEIKSRLLLPKVPNPNAANDEDFDPRAELIRRLQEYERFKNAALALDCIPRLERDLYLSNSMLPPLETRIIAPEVNINELLLALRGVLTRSSVNQNHMISREALSVRERMSAILDKLHHINFIRFETLFEISEGRLGVAVSFVAVLEMLKLQQLEIVQNGAYAPIYVRLMSIVAL